MTHVERHRTSSLRKLGALFLTLSVGMFLLVFYALHGSMGFNAVRLPLEEQVHTQRWLPQGWAFFTRDPSEARLFAYGRDNDGRWRSRLITPHGRPQNAFGMDRASRAQGVEVGQLYERLRASAFKPCIGALSACLEKLEASVRLDNSLPKKTLCGTIAIVKRQPLPWAWSSWEKKTQMPATAARLEVQC
jgi:antimicrobial peptide system SdpA family protein